MSTIAKKVKEAAKADKVVVPAVSDKQHQETIELLRGRTMEMSFTVHGLPKSRKITGKLGEKVAASVSGKRKGVRASWSMFTSEHPAVKELNAAIRELEQLRDTWTIVRSAEVQKGDGDKVSIEGGKRLIWDKDIPEFYAQFTAKARLIDKCVEKLQHAMDNETYDANDNKVASVKDMDKENAGEAWDESVYPKDLSQVVGVSKERNPDGTPRVGDDGYAVYVISFNEYHVSEKLPQLLRERAIKRIDEGLSGTVETAMTYAVNELSEQMLTFLGELSNRVKVFPVAKSEYGMMFDGEIVKQVTDDDDPKMAAGTIKALIRYKDEASDTKISKWVGPMPKKKFADELKPQATAEKKKIYPSVIENIIEQLTAFKDKKSKMLGVYGDNMVKAFEPLLESLLAAKKVNPYTPVNKAAQQLAQVLKGDDDVKKAMSKSITDTVELLEEQVLSVQETHKRRRTVKASLIGKV
jgi:hypothetical protein